MQKGVCGGWTRGPPRTKRRPIYPGICGPSFPSRSFFRLRQGQRPRDLRLPLRDPPQYPSLVIRNQGLSSLPSSRSPESNETQVFFFPCFVCAKGVGSNSFECSLFALCVNGSCSGMSRKSDYTGNSVWRCPRCAPAPVVAPLSANSQNPQPADPHHL